MAACDLLSENRCGYPPPMLAHSPLEDALAGILQGEGTNDTNTSVLQCWVCIQLYAGSKGQCSHQTTVRASCPELSEGSHTACAKWLPGSPFSVAPVMDLTSQRRLLLFITLHRSSPEGGGDIWSPIFMCNLKHPHSSSHLSV